MTDPIFTPEQISESGKNAVARTNGQTGVAGSAIIVGLWVARQLGWHGEMPAEVVVAVGVLLTWGAAYKMNRDKIRATK